MTKKHKPIPDHQEGQPPADPAEGQEAAAQHEDAPPETPTPPADTNVATGGHAPQPAPESSEDGLPTSQAEADGPLDPMAEPVASATPEQTAAANSEEPVDADITAAELQQLTDDRQPGDLPPSVNAADPLEEMAVLGDDGDPAYVRWLEGLVETYRKHCKELREHVARHGVASPELPYYAPYRG